MIRPKLKIATGLRYEWLGFPKGTRVVVSAVRWHAPWCTMQVLVEEPKGLRGWRPARPFEFYRNSKVEKE